MAEYNPKASNKLVDKQLNREQHESEESKSLAKGQDVNTAGKDGGEPERESYNTIPGN